MTHRNGNTTKLGVTHSPKTPPPRVTHSPPQQHVRFRRIQWRHLQELIGWADAQQPPAQSVDVDHLLLGRSLPQGARAIRGQLARHNAPWRVHAFKPDTIFIQRDTPYPADSYRPKRPPDRLADPNDYVMQALAQQDGRDNAEPDEDEDDEDDEDEGEPVVL
jgi:hypothetical protein